MNGSDATDAHFPLAESPRRASHMTATREYGMGRARRRGFRVALALTVVKRTYRRDGMQIVASVMSGVLIDFTITPL